MELSVLYTPKPCVKPIPSTMLRERATRQLPASLLEENAHDLVSQYISTEHVTHMTESHSLSFMLDTQSQSPLPHFVPGLGDASS